MDPGGNRDRSRRPDETRDLVQTLLKPHQRAVGESQEQKIRLLKPLRACVCTCVRASRGERRDQKKERGKRRSKN